MKTAHRSMNVHPFHETYAGEELRAFWLTKRARPTHKQMICTEGMVHSRGGRVNSGVRAAVLRSCFPPIMPMPNDFDQPPPVENKKP